VAFIPKGITSTEWARARKIAIAHSDGRCTWCGQPLVPNAPKRSAMSTSVDHITPRAAFEHLDLATVRHMFLGQHNLSVKHMRCNSAKAAREPTTASTTVPTANSLDWAERSLEMSS
jgi:hypothetical protein